MKGAGEVLTPRGLTVRRTIDSEPPPSARSNGNGNSDLRPQQEQSPPANFGSPRRAPKP